MKDKDKKDKVKKKDDNRGQQSTGLGRRALMKMGVGAGVAAGVAAMTQILHVPEALAQDAAAPRKFVPPPAAGGSSRGVEGGPPYLSSHTWTRRVVKYGWKNDSGRAFGNGPMDETSRRIVTFASAFKQPELTDKLVADIGDMFLDTIGCAIAGFESDSVRAVSKLSRRLYPAGELKSTIWGYGIETTPEMAGFVGSCMVRHCDDNSEGMHETDQMPAIVAIGEALHQSGPQVLSALILFWEVFAALLTAQPSPGAPGNRGVWSSVDNWVHAPATAVAVSKMLGLNDDQMANAISLSFVNHIALMVDHWRGPNSMSKSNHDAVLARAGIFAAFQAREGVTGPAEPFEGEKGIMDVITGRFDLQIPAKVSLQPTRPLAPGDNRFAIQTLGYKRSPGNSSGSGYAAVVMRDFDEYRKFAKPEDITAIEMEVNQWGDGEDEGKWDPMNSETADHSPYLLARALIDGDVWEGSFTKDKLSDPLVRQLMSKMTLTENPDKRGSTFTIRNKAGQSLTKQSGGGPTERMTHEELQKKYERNCAWKGVSKEQTDKIRTTWADLRNVKDISVTVRETLAHYGKPAAL